MFGLKPHQIEAMQRCFSAYTEIQRVLVYGSRAMGTYKPASDIDLTIEGDLPLNKRFQLENELDDLLLPYKIDLSLKHQITNAALLDHINRVGKIFYEKSKVPI